MTKYRPPREEIIALAAEGLTNQQIADRLGFTVRTLDRDRARDPLLNDGIMRARAALETDRLAPCGTPSAYHRHLRRGEPTDAACRRASADRQLARDRRRREALGMPPPNSGLGRPRKHTATVHAVATPAALHVRVEQAIASGLSVSQIMARLDVDYATVKTIRDQLLAGAA